MRKSSEFTLVVIWALLLLPAGTFCQDKDTEHGSVEFGLRFATGDVYGRPDLPFQPSLKTSQFNEYQDVRDGFYVRRFDVKFDNVLRAGDSFRGKADVFTNLVDNYIDLEQVGTTTSRRH